jgi:hypothetical protein
MNGRGQGSVVFHDGVPDAHMMMMMMMMMMLQVISCIAHVRSGAVLEQAHKTREDGSRRLIGTDAWNPTCSIVSGRHLVNCKAFGRGKQLRQWKLVELNLGKEECEISEPRPLKLAF